MEKKLALVVGMAKSGIASAQLLSRMGYCVRISDRKKWDEFKGALDVLKGYDIEDRLGEKAETLLEGVSLVVISPGIPITHPLVASAKDKGVELIGELELAYRVSKAPLIAITGTNGKTTTTMLTGTIIKNAGITPYVVGNIGDPFAEIADKTTQKDAVVCEVSSFQMESADLYHPHVAAILNITEDHLNRHFTMETYINCKKRVFARQDENDFLVLNYDDATLRGMEKESCGKVVWFSRKEEVSCGAFVRGDDMIFRDEAGERVIGSVSKLGIPGKHNLENALAAGAITSCFGIDSAVIAQTMEEFQGVEHRIEFVREVDGVRYINDSKGTNVDSTIKAIETMDRPTVILLGGSEKNVSMVPLIESIKGSFVKKAVLIGQTADQLQRTFDDADMPIYERAGYDFALALEKARGMAQEGWNVLLSPACASFDMFEDYEERGRIFKDMVMHMSAKNA